MEIKIGSEIKDKKDGLKFVVKEYNAEFDEYTVDTYYWPAEVLCERGQVKSGEYLRYLA